jgi:6-phosphogluconolactonase
MARFDTVTGELTEPVAVARMENPSYLALSPLKDLLFAVGEGDGTTPNLGSYRVNPESGMLTLADSLVTGGISSCYVSLVTSNRVAFANYSSGDVTFVKFDEQGGLSESPVTFEHTGSGPNTARQTEAHAHSIRADRAMQYIYAADLGSDQLNVYQLEGDEVVKVTSLAMTPGAGPRHLDFHPSGKLMALLNELNHSIDLFVADDKGLFSIKTQTVSLLPDSLHQKNWSADIHFSEDGQHLYASVRGVNRIDAFTVDVESTTIHLIGSVVDGINWPRGFTLDPTGGFLLVANQKGNDVVVFRRDARTGLLTPTGHRLEVSQPVCLKF